MSKPTAEDVDLSDEWLRNLSISTPNGKRMWNWEHRWRALKRVRDAARAEGRREGLERDQSWKAIVHHMALMLCDFGKHEPECVCSGDQTSHAADCLDCDCGLADAVNFGVEQSGLSIEPPPATPEEEQRLAEIGKRIVAEAIRAMKGGVE